MRDSRGDPKEAGGKRKEEGRAKRGKKHSETSGSRKGGQNKENQEAVRGVRAFGKAG